MVTDTPANVTVDGVVSGRSRSVIEVDGMDNLTELHNIRVTAEGHSEHKQSVRLQAGQVVTVPIELAKVGGT